MTHQDQIVSLQLRCQMLRIELLSCMETLDTILEDLDRLLADSKKHESHDYA